MYIYINTRNLGKRIDELRKQHNDSKRKLAQIIPINESHLGRLLKDDSEWKQEYVQKIAKYYGVTEAFLYNAAIKPEAENSDPKELLDRSITSIESYPDAEREQIYINAIMRMLTIIKHKNNDSDP